MVTAEAKLFSAHKMIPFIISLSFFMEAVDSTVINTAIPAMSRSLLVEPVDLKVALISYLISLAIFIPISGWLADKFGSKKIFMIALFIFTLSSLWCGFAQNVTDLVVARFVQGFGGALGLPVGRLIIARTFRRGQLITMMSRVAMIGAIGMMLGPVIGGFITHYFSWHWIFWVNIPVGMLALGLAYYWLDNPAPQRVHPLDKWGFIFFGVALAGISLGLSALSETTVNNAIALSLILFSMIVFIVYCVHSRNELHPIVKTDLLRLRTFQIAVVGNLISRLGFGGVPFLMPLLLQVGFGFSAQLSGLLLAPVAAGVLLAKPCTLPVLRALGYKRFLMMNTVLSGVFMGLVACINVDTPLYCIGFWTFLYGVILALQYGAMNSLAYADLTSDSLSAATSIMATIQQLAQSFGVAMSALFIRLFSEGLFRNGALTPSVFHYTFLAIGFVTLLSSLIFIRLRDEDGQQMLIVPE